MHTLGWSAFYYYARARKSAWTAVCGAMLSLACAPSYTRAQAPAGASAPPKTGAEVLSGLRGHGVVQTAAEKVLLAADAPLIADILRTGSSRSSRETAVAAVSRIGPRSVPALLTFLDDAEIGPLAGRVLFQVAGGESVSRVPDLLDCLRSKPMVSRYCGDTLVKVCGPKAAAHTALLSRALADEDVLVRVYAAAALGRIGASARAAVPALAKALADAQPAVRRQAAAALGAMGSAAKPATAALVKASSDPVAEVAYEARRARRKIRG